MTPEDRQAIIDKWAGDATRQIARKEDETYIIVEMSIHRALIDFEAAMLREGLTIIRPEKES